MLALTVIELKATLLVWFVTCRLSGAGVTVLPTILPVAASLRLPDDSLHANGNSDRLGMCLKDPAAKLHVLCIAQTAEGLALTW